MCFDPEMAGYVTPPSEEKGIRVITGASGRVPLLGEGTGDRRPDRRRRAATARSWWCCPLGIRPNTAFLEDTGIEMFKGTILVDEQHAPPTCRTSTPPATAPW